MEPRIQINFGAGYEDMPLPFNAEDIAWEAIFTNEFPSATLQAVPLEWRGPAAAKLNAYFDAGLTGGNGVYEGVPIQITTGTPSITYSCVINLADPSIERSSESFKAPLKLVGSIDWLSDTLESITYLLLTQTGLPATGSQPAYPAIIGTPGSGAKYTYKQTPFVETIPADIPMAITLIMEEYSMVNHIIKAGNDTVKSTSKVLADLGLTASVIEAPVGVADGIADFAGMLLDDAFDIILGVAIVGNVEMLLNQFGLVKRYKYSMTVRDEINAAIDYINSLGVTSPYTFSSTIFNTPGNPYYNLTLMPRKSLKETSSLTKAILMGGPISKGTEIGIPNTYGYYDYDAKKLVQQINQVFNAKGYLFANNFSMEEVHYYNNKSSFTLKNVDKPGYNFDWPKPDATNASELSWYYRIAWMLDPLDERTSIVYTGTSCSVTLQPKTVGNPLNLIPPGSTDITFPFALAKRKEYLNVIEQVINDMLNVLRVPYNALISAYNFIANIVNDVGGLFGNSNILKALPYMPSNPLNALIGCLEVSSDHWNEQKLYIGTPSGGNGAKNLEGVYRNADWLIDPNNGANNNGIWVNPNVPASTPFKGEGWMSAFAIGEQYHFLNLATRGNQWLLYKNKRFPMLTTDFTNILGHNVFTTADNFFAKFDKMTYKEFRDMAQNVNYRINKKWTDNLYEILSVDGN